MTESATPPSFRWWHALAILAISNGLSLAPAVVRGAEAFSTDFQLPPFAPPTWAFAPIWLFLNVTSLVALGRVVNHCAPSRRRRLLLGSEAAGWLLFASFTSLYFGLQSAILSAVDTVAALAVAVVSTGCAVGLDRTAAALIGLRLLWLLLAGAVAVVVALTNTDPLFAGLGG